ncbi:MAG: BMC domain-containing protein [Coriobacteriia bacterium]|nr:BMC domain-containing protein [Coriobacteriia bacterium]
MNIALGMIELNSIAKGIETSDFMVKAADVDIIKESTVCPGKFIIIVYGKTESVNTAVKEGIKKGAECVVDTLFIPKAHESLVPAISNVNEVGKVDALGVIEFYSVASAIKAADAAAKAANITLIEVRIGYAVGGKGYVTLTGDIGSVRAAVKSAIADSDLLVNTVIIPRPSKKVIDSLL